MAKDVVVYHCPFFYSIQLQRMVYCCEIKVGMVEIKWPTGCAVCYVQRAGHGSVGGCKVGIAYQARWQCGNSPGGGGGYINVQNVEVTVVEQTPKGPCSPRFAARPAKRKTRIVGHKINARPYGVSAQVDKYFHTLAHQQLHFGHWHGCIQQAAIIAYNIKRTVIAEAQIIASFHFCVEYS